MSAMWSTLKQLHDELFASYHRIFLTFVTLTIASYYVHRKWSRRHLPAGPPGLPVLGYFPFLNRFAPYKSLIELSHKYGPVFTVQMGTADNVILVGWPAIKEAFKQEGSLGRPPENAFTALTPLKGFAMASGPEWRDQKKVSLKLLRDLGLGRNTMEVHIIDEISKLIAAIEQHNQNGVQVPLEIRKILSPSVSNNIFSLAYGKRYDYSHPRRKMMDDMLDPSTTNTLLVIMMIIFSNMPRLFRVLGFFGLLGTRKTMAQNKEVIEYTRKEIRDHEKTLDKNNIRDFIDGFLVEIAERQKSDPGSFFNHESLLANVIGFFFAGSDTVRTTLEWFILTLSVHQDVQDKICHEIESVIGSRTPNYSDRTLMPYTQAVMCEIQRWRTVLPTNLPRLTTEDIVVQGVKIPKNSKLLAIIYSVHHDEKIFPEPEVFRPERFLDQDGRFFKPEEYMPFSYGKRSCPGESLAMVEIFLYTTRILQEFQILAPPGVESDFTEKSGVTSAPLTPVKVIFQQRAAI